MKSFFDKRYQTPLWFTEKKETAKASAQQQSRRKFLKSAAGASAMVTMPSFSFSLKDKKSLLELTQSDPWLTLDATLMHLLPDSKTSNDPSAKDINALAYLHQIITVQPTAEDEKEFILKGVGWLNGYANSELGKAFVQLTFDEKEIILRGISGSRAGENWLATLMTYLFEAMLAPPAYGGNTNGSGWQWLEHQAGFPLPGIGQRYFELPPRARTKNEIVIKEISATKSSNTLAKTPSVKRISKA